MTMERKERDGMNAVMAGNEGEENRDAAGNADSPLMDVKEAARMLRISESMFYKMNKKGKTPPAVMVGKLRRWRKKDLLKWIDDGCPAAGTDGKRRSFPDDENQEKGR